MARGLVNQSPYELARELLRSRLLRLNHEQIVDVMVRLIKREAALDYELQELRKVLHAKPKRRST